MFLPESGSSCSSCGLLPALCDSLKGRSATLIAHHKITVEKQAPWLMSRPWYWWGSLFIPSLYPSPPSPWQQTTAWGSSARHFCTNATWGKPLSPPSEHRLSLAFILPRPTYSCLRSCIDFGKKSTGQSDALSCKIRSVQINGQLTKSCKLKLN